MSDKNDIKQNNDGYLSIDELLKLNKIQQDSVIKEIEREELLEFGSETIDDIKSDIKKDVERSEILKSKFINEIKNGLGDEMKSNPNRVRIVKKPWYVKMNNFLKNILTRF